MYLPIICYILPGDPPEPEELIKALIDLENSASSDAVVRERIANLPPEVSEVAMLAKLEDKESAAKLAAQVRTLEKQKCTNTFNINRNPFLGERGCPDSARVQCASVR